MTFVQQKPHPVQGGDSLNVEPLWPSVLQCFTPQCHATGTSSRQAPTRKPTPAIVCRAREYKAPAEWQADQFAARLLMPASDVRAVMRTLHGDEPATIRGLEASRKAGQLDVQLRGLADGIIADGKFSNVSNEAMCYRLLDLKLVTDASAVQGRLL